MRGLGAGGWELGAGGLDSVFRGDWGTGGSVDTAWVDWRAYLVRFRRKLSGFSVGTVTACGTGMRSNSAYRKLETWQVSMDFVEACYRATRTFPREELYGLTSQIRRAVISVPSNVAEGYCRRNAKVYLNHVRIALGSHAEIETCLEIASRLAYLQPAVYAMLDQHLGSVGRLLYALHRSLEERLRLEQTKRSPLVP